ncbi:hypothetical protein OFY01_17450, partial [Streptomyces sp. GXMU-J5]|nr:hypothetical protein [Streptomyces beihaiensis]
RDWAAAEREGRSIAPFITRLNEIRRRHPALHRLRNLRFHATDNDALIAYSKHGTCARGREGEGEVGSGAAVGAGADDTVLVVVNLDPHHPQEGTVFLDLNELGLNEPVRVHDEISGETYRWGRHNYVRLEPGRAPAHVLAVR